MSDSKTLCDLYMNSIFDLYATISPHHETVDGDILRRDFWKTFKSWSKIVETILMSWGWNKSAIKMFQMWGRGGHNWKILHWDEGGDFVKAMEDFAGEIYYCSDRMSLDRLARCHWEINRASNLLELER